MTIVKSGDKTIISNVSTFRYFDVSIYKTREFQYRVTGPDIDLATRAPAEQLPVFIISDASDFKHYKFPPLHIGPAKKAN
jgi:hypothetical protein